MLVLGNVYEALGIFCRLQLPSPDSRAKLKHDITIYALELLTLAAGALALSSLTSFLWILTA